MSDFTVMAYALAFIAVALWKREIRAAYRWAYVKACAWRTRKAPPFTGADYLDWEVQGEAGRTDDYEVSLEGYEATCYTSAGGHTSLKLTPKHDEPQVMPKYGKPRKPRRKRNPGK